MKRLTYAFLKSYSRTSSPSYFKRCVDEVKLWESFIFNKDQESLRSMMVGQFAKLMDKSQVSFVKTIEENCKCVQILPLREKS